MTLISEVKASKNYLINLVVKIGDTYFSKRQVDSGLTVDSDKVGMIDGVTINPTVIDLTRTKTSINNSTINMLDNEVFTAFIGASENSLIRESVDIYMGLNTGSFAWSDYVLVSSYTVKNITKKGNIYTISAVSKTNIMQAPLFDQKGTLTSGITDSQTSIDVDSSDDIFQTANYLKIDNEFISYSGKSYSSGVTTFTGCTRGTLGSDAAAHTQGTIAYEVTEIEDNPVDILLQIMISGSGGGSPYDVLHDGLAIDEAFIDITKFEYIRDNFFVSDEFRFYLYDISNVLDFVEAEILQPNNLRFVESENGISIGILDQSVPGAVLPIIDKDNSGSQPSWQISEDRILNKITWKWGWSEGLQKFTRVTTLEDTTSQTTFGVKKGDDLEFKGIQADLSGQSIINDRMARFLARFSTPQVQIEVDKCHFETYENNPSDKILFSHPDVPQEGGGLGINTELEIVSKALNVRTGQIKFKLVYTSYYNIRRGLIAPAQFLTSVTDQKTFTVSDVSKYQVGYFLRLWNITYKYYEPGPSQEIESIDELTNTIVLKNDFFTIPRTDNILKFADYDEASPEQRARYAFISPNTGFFDDNTKSYQITI